MARFLHVRHALGDDLEVPDVFPPDFTFDVRDGVLHIFTSSQMQVCAKAYNRDVWAAVEHVEVVE